MYRALLSSLTAWKNQPKRKPLLVDGARQTGKTYLLRELFAQQFPRTLYLDFLAKPALATAFSGSLAPQDVLDQVRLMTGQDFEPTTDLLILDEIGECERAVTALKYFAEQMPEAYVAASGSNIGLLATFPVGKVTQFVMRPLSFREFLRASGNQAVIDAFQSRARSEAAHLRLLDFLTDYYFTGGMPEAVANWYANADLMQRVRSVSQIHADLDAGYRRDFGKYSGKVDAQLIEAVFDQIPAQLYAVQDESVKRFYFKGVHPRKSRYADFASAISWLHKSRLVFKNYPIEGCAQSPLMAQRKDSRVKLFLFDVGLLNHSLRSTYQEIKAQSAMYKGFVAENFVQQELACVGFEPSFSWQDARAEVEFLVADQLGNVIPIEVKSGQRTRAKSLTSYRQKCKPTMTIKLTASQGSPPEQQTDVVIPLYYAESIVPELLGGATR